MKRVPSLRTRRDTPPRQIDWIECGVTDFPFNAEAGSAIHKLKENGREDVSALLGCLNHAVIKLAERDSIYHENVLHASFQWLRWFASGNNELVPSIWSMV